MERWKSYRLYLKWGIVMIDTKEMGRRLQNFRRATNLTQEEVAELLEISSNYVSNIETGRDLCSTEVLVGMANLYHASMDYILGESLRYNADRESNGPEKTALMHEFGRLSNEECAHLIKYIQFLRESKP